MKMNITQAAKAVGKSRKTLYRHIDAGKVSVEKDATDNPVIDVSELQRVYGEVNTKVTGHNMGQKDTEKQPATSQKSTNDTELQAVKLRLEYAEKERDTERERRQEAERREREAQRREDETREEVRRLLEIVDTQTKQLAPPKTEDQQPEEPPKRRKILGIW